MPIILMGGDRKICLCCGWIDPPRQTTYGAQECHVVEEQDHHWECDGSCVNVSCPELYERLCGPMHVIGHGGKLRSASASPSSWGSPPF